MTALFAPAIPELLIVATMVLIALTTVAVILYVLTRRKR